MLGFMAGCQSQPGSQPTESSLILPESLPDSLPDSAFYWYYDRFDAERRLYPHPRLLPMDLMNTFEPVAGFGQDANAD